MIGLWRVGWGLMWGTGSFFTAKKRVQILRPRLAGFPLARGAAGFKNFEASFQISFLHKNALITHHFNRKLVLVFAA